jgi:hypothetical protein
MLQGVTRIEPNSLIGEIRNADAILRVLSEPVVIEQSPPDWVTLTDLLKNAASPTQIGVYVGIAAALPVNPLLMLITVPAGILLVGTSIALTERLNRLLK